MKTTVKPIVYNRSNYFHKGGPQQFDQILDAARTHLKDVDFDTFVVTGHSGVSVSALFSAWFKKPVFIIRKQEEVTHDWQKHYGEMGRRWVFLDDLIDSGDTLRRVYGWVSSREFGIMPAGWDMPNSDNNWNPFFVGSYEYIPNREVFTSGDYLIDQYNLKALADEEDGL